MERAYHSCQPYRCLELILNALLHNLFELPFLLDVAAHLLGIYLAINALFQSRTSQGATAWFIGLIGFPYLGIPLFIIFGRRRYHDEQGNS